MSTVKADNFTWKTGEATAQVGSSVTGPQIVYGVAKSWINFNSITSTFARASFNISSLTDNGTGDTTINFSNALSDANYTFSGSTAELTGSIVNYNQGYISQRGASTYTSNALRFSSAYVQSAAPNDFAVTNVTIHR